MRFRLKGKLLTRLLPVFVWVMATVVVGVLFLYQSETVQLKGIAFYNEQTINSVETGYLSSVEVKLYQKVEEGQTLAIIKENTVAREAYVDALLEAKKKTAEAELLQLKAELAAAEDRLIAGQYEQQSETTAMERRLSVDLERARLELLEIKSTLEPDRLAMKDLEVELEIIKRLVDEQATEEYELQKAQAQYDIMKEKVDQTQALLDQSKVNYELARLRKDEFSETLPKSPLLSDRELAPIREAIIVRETKIKELIKQHGIIVLTAPFDGIVTALNCKSGQTVVRGEAIMTIVEQKPESITAWVPQKKMGRFVQNMKVKVVSLNTPQRSFVSQISNISPAMELMPQQLWQNPTIPEWGRPIQIPIQPNFACAHNEVVGITTVTQ